MALLMKAWIRSGLFEMIAPKVPQQKHSDNRGENSLTTTGTMSRLVMAWRVLEYNCDDSSTSWLSGEFDLVTDMRSFNLL